MLAATLALDQRRLSPPRERSQAILVKVREREFVGC